MRWALVLVCLVPGLARANASFVPPDLGPPARADAVGRPGVLAKQWIEAAYGLDVDRVPVYVLPQTRFDALYQRLGGRATKMNVSVDGFAYKGVVFVKKGGLFGIGAKTLAHELLHALSTRFTDEAQAQGRHNLIEGLTEFFTNRASPPERLPPGVRVRRSVYGAYATFAAELANLIGIEELARCYFDAGYLALEERVDRRVGRGRLRRAARFLEVDDLGSALRVLYARR